MLPNTRRPAGAFLVMMLEYLQITEECSLAAQHSMTDIRGKHCTQRYMCLMQLSLNFGAKYFPDDCRQPYLRAG